MKELFTPDREQMEKEEKRIRSLRVRVDLVCALLYQQSIDREEAEALIRGVKRYALELFPDREDTFDLIYGTRFRRILWELFPDGG